LKLQTMFFLWGTGNYVLLFCSNQYTWCVCVCFLLHMFPLSISGEEESPLWLELIIQSMVRVRNVERKHPENLPMLSVIQPIFSVWT
jgi:hypothetical protein